MKYLRVVTFLDCIANVSCHTVIPVYSYRKTDSFNILFLSDLDFDLFISRVLISFYFVYDLVIKKW